MCSSTTARPSARRGIGRGPSSAIWPAHATVNIVTNQHAADLMTEWGAPSLVMFDPFLELPIGYALPHEIGLQRGLHQHLCQ